MGMRIFVVLSLCVLASCGSKTSLETKFFDASVNDQSLDRGQDRGQVDVGRDVSTDAMLPCPECDDGIFCNGPEQCAPDGRCISGVVPSCEDTDECTIDACDAATDRCSNVPRDRDEDGDGVSACNGDCDDTDSSIFPGAAEVCDMQDQDCDMGIDEGVLSVCNDCRPGCRVAIVPETTGWDLTSADANGVVVENGNLQLTQTNTESYFAWVANTRFGTVTKLDTRNGSQVGEYDSVLVGPSNNGRPAGEICRPQQGGGNCPSRTAIDLKSAVYIANRAFQNQGTVTKVAGLEEDCIDRNGNGQIETSRDLNGNGVIDPGSAEFVGQDDECILWTVDVGNSDGVPRAVAVAASGNIWVGLHNGRAVVELSPDDGALLRTVRFRSGFISGFAPYGAAISGDGKLWLTEGGTGRIVWVDTNTGDFSNPETVRSRSGCEGSYGIAVDEKNRVWVAGFQCPYAYRYDFSDNLWFEVPLPDSGGTRGIAADGDGNIYVATSHTFLNIDAAGLTLGDPISRVTRFRADDGSNIRIYGTPSNPLPGSATVGIGFDANKDLWMVNQGSATATRLNTTTGAFQEFPVGEEPYTYSDFTGFALRTFTVPNGFIRQFAEGCAVGPTEWEVMNWNANLPAGTRLELRVRTAQSPRQLQNAEWVGPIRSSPTNLTLPPGPLTQGRFLEAELTLLSDDSSVTPSVRDVRFQYNCPVEN